MHALRKEVVPLDFRVCLLSPPFYHSRLICLPQWRVITITKTKQITSNLLLRLGCMQAKLAFGDVGSAANGFGDDHYHNTDDECICVCTIKQ